MRKEKTIVIIPAAGLGTRLYPLTSWKAKAMVEVAGKPVICHILEYLAPYVDEVRIVYRDDQLVDYLKRRTYPFDLKFYQQTFPTGPLDAISKAVYWEDEALQNARLLIWLSDTILSGGEFEFPAAECAVWTSTVGDYKRWCLIDENGVIFDKPVVDPITRQALIGIYSFNDFAKAAKKIRHRTGCEISDLLKMYDKPVQVPAPNWCDTGEIETLLDTRSKLLNSREDNSIRIDFFEGKVIKKGPRVVNEAFWYSQTPASVEKFIPRIYKISESYIEMEYVPAKTLQQILVYENCHPDMIRFMLKSVLQKYQMAFSEQWIDDETSTYMFYEKAKERLSQIERMGIIDQNEIEEVKYVLDSDEYQVPLKKSLGKGQVIHGDFHFGNILFDIDSNKMWMIDPRGDWDKSRTIYGSPIYDYAKFYQSACCEYMWVINGAETDIDLRDKIVEILDQHFGSNGLFYKYVACILQMTCLPFHKDSVSRQKKLWRKAFNCLRRLRGGIELK